MYTSIICAFTCKRSSKCTRGNSSSRRLFYTFNLTSSRSASRLKCANSCLTLPSSLLQLWCAWLIYIHCTHKHWGQKLARMCIFSWNQFHKKFFREIDFFFKNRWIASFSLFLLLQIFCIVKIISKVRNFYNQGEFSLDKKNRTKFYVLWQSVFIYKLRNYKRHSIFLQRHFISYRSSNILYVLRYLLQIFFSKIETISPIIWIFF